MTDSGAERAARRIMEFFRMALIPQNVERMGAIIQEETGTQWISVSARLPEISDRYLVVAGFPRPHIAELQNNLRGELRWFRDGGNGDITDSVTHWAALPPAPEEGGKR